MTAGPHPFRDAAFQRLWTKYAALPQYDKEEWTAAFNEIWESPGAPAAARRAPTEAMIDAAFRSLYGYVNASDVRTEAESRERGSIAEALRAALAAGDGPA